MIKIDIVIPVYNKEISIEKTLDSVINQEVKFDNIIIVNDGSTDNTKSIIKSFKDRCADIKINIIDQKNQGVSEARNNGIKFSNADYITLLDGDDELELNYLSEIKRLINKYKKGKAFSAKHINLYSIAQNKKYQNLNKKNLKDKIIKYPLLTNSFFKNIFCASGITFARSIILKNLFPKKIEIGEDIYVWQKIFTNHSLVISDSNLIKVNKYAENRAQNIIKDYPFYLYKFNKLSKLCKNFKYLISLIVFHVTSLLIEINKSKYLKNHNQKKFENLVNSQNIIFKILCKIFNLNFLFFFYNIYKKNNKSFIKIIPQINYSLIVYSAPLFFIVFYIKGYEEISVKYLIYSSFNLIIFTLFTFQTRVYLIYSNLELTFFNIFFRNSVFLLLLFCAVVSIQYFIKLDDKNLYFLSLLVVGFFWVLEFIVLKYEKLKKIIINLFIFFYVILLYFIFIFVPIEIITNKILFYLILFKLIISIFLFLSQMKKIKINNIIQTIFKKNYGTLFFLTALIYSISNFLWRYNFDKYSNINNVSFNFFIFSLATIPSTFYKSILAPLSYEIKKIEVLYLKLILIILFLLFLFLSINKNQILNLDIFLISSFVGAIILLIGNMCREKYILLKTEIKSLFFKDFLFCLGIVTLSYSIIYSDHIVNYYYLIIGMLSIIFFKKRFLSLIFFQKDEKLS